MSDPRKKDGSWTWLVFAVLIVLFIFGPAIQSCSGSSSAPLDDRDLHDRDRAQEAYR